MTERKTLTNVYDSKVSTWSTDIPYTGTTYNTLSNDSLLYIECNGAKNITTTEIFQVLLGIVYLIPFILGILGNTIICYIVATTPNMKKVKNYFIFNLAISDILITLCCLPFTVISMSMGTYWPFGSIMCKVVKFAQNLSVLVSAYTLVAISIDRYVIIMWPLKPRIGKTAAKIIVGTVWLMSFIVTSPLPIVSALDTPVISDQACRMNICIEKWPEARQEVVYTMTLVVLQFVLPLCVLLYTYGRTTYAVWTTRPPGDAPSVNNLQTRDRRKEALKMMIAVVIVFSLCWMPLNFLHIYRVIYTPGEPWVTWPKMSVFWMTFNWLAMSHCCYNPMIYCFMNIKYQQRFKEVMKRIVCLQRSPGAEQGRASHQIIKLSDIEGRTTNAPTAVA